MDYPYRKFFLFIPCMLLIFSCALPNFAALAPAPAPTNPAPIRPSASQVPATAQTVNNGQDVQSAGSTVTIEPPDSPDPIVELPTVAVAATDNDSADQTQFDIGAPYQLSRSAVFFHKPPAGQSLVYSLSGGSQLEFSSEPTGQVGELIVVETEDGMLVVNCPAGDDPILVAERNRGTLVDEGPFASYEDAMDAVSDLQTEEDE